MKQYVKILSIIMLFSLKTVEIVAQVPNPNTSEKFNKLFTYAHTNGMFNGSVLIIDNKSLVYKKSYGDTKNQENKPITSNTQFLLASLSKQFTATGIVLLHEQGKLKFDDKVIQHLPDFPYSNVTIRNLLNQTSGILEYEKLLNNQFSKLEKSYNESGKIITNNEVYALYKKRKPKLEFTPNKKFNYSNTNYVFLALLIEKVSGQSFAKYMQTQIFSPLQMNNTFVYNALDTSNFFERAIGYKLKIDGENIEVNDNYPFINIVGDGGIYSTIDDLQKYILALNENKIMSKESRREAFSKPTLLNTEKSSYGFGWFIKTIPFNKHKAITHSGEFVGFSNAIFNDLDAKKSIILLSNNSSKYRAQLNSAMVRILYDIPYELPKKNIRGVIGELIYEKSIEVAIETYKKLKNENFNKYNFKENQLNRLGYDLLEQEKLQEAIAIFKLNVSSYPESSNVYDSLGEAYLLNNQKELALFNYKKSVSLHPDNKKAIEIIKELQK